MAGYLTSEERRALQPEARKTLRTTRRREVQAANKLRRRERATARRAWVAEFVEDLQDAGLSYTEEALRAWVSNALRNLAEEWPDEQATDQMDDAEIAAELTDLFIDRIDFAIDWKTVKLPLLEQLGMTVGATLEMLDGPLLRLLIGNRVERAIYAILVDAK
jgi:hypothetical protein